MRRLLVLHLLTSTAVTGFLTHHRLAARPARLLGAVSGGCGKPEAVDFLGSAKPSVVSKALASATLCGVLALSPVAVAYNPTDYASETVQATLQSLEAASGNLEQTYKVYEDLNAIITEGKGVGGEINYKGVQLDRGYIADEDTAIYNPGLTLLTESEKERLVEAVISARKAGLSAGQWNEEAELGFEFLRMKLDPYHMVELRGYLRLVPFITAVVYVAVTAVQQFARDLFPLAYFIGVGAVVVPAVVLILLGQ